MPPTERQRRRMPATLKPEHICAVQDTREQTPLCLDPLRVEVDTLTTGDYSVRGMEHLVAVERKNLDDLCGVVGRDRERFEREVQRLLAYPVRCLVVESTWSAIELGQWRSHVKPEAVLGSLIGWMAQGLPVACVADHRRAGQFVSRLLFTAARRRWRESRELIGEVEKRQRSPEAVEDAENISQEKAGGKA